MMEIIEQSTSGATAAVVAVGVAVVTWAYGRTIAQFRRPRSVELAPGLYHFEDGKVEDGGLEWRPVEELFK